ncbi:unnamed protein product [Cochlearia groenlandica]
MRSHLANLKLYKFDVPYYSNVGVVLITKQHQNTGFRFILTRYTGEKHSSKAGLSQSFIDLLATFFFYREQDCNITNQIITYLASNYSFNDLETVPPACPVLVFHFNISELHDKDDHIGATNIVQDVMDVLRIEDTILDIDDVVAGRFISIDPNNTEILDCYNGEEELCFVCEKGYDPREENIVYKTKCNHIFHATCISNHLSRTPRCPICSKDLAPIDIRTLLFNT